MDQNDEPRSYVKIYIDSDDDGQPLTEDTLDSLTEELSDWMTVHHLRLDSEVVYSYEGQ